MHRDNSLLCDGCGQPASPAHVASRLQRLEWATRYRPVHIGTLLLGAFSPQKDSAFLYAGKFEGEAGAVLRAMGIHPAGKPTEAVLSEIQRAGYFLTHVLECALDAGNREPASERELLAARIDSASTRIRRSLKPKRIALISDSLTPLLPRIKAAELNIPLLLDVDAPFALDSAESFNVIARLAHALGA